MFDFILSLTVLSAFVLLGGSYYLWRKQGVSRQSTLMAVLAFVMLANVLIWTIPGDGQMGGDAGTGTAAP